MTIFDVINVAGGLALFLYGMTIMGAGLEKVAGSKLESILKKLTSSTIKAVALGAIITGIIQSSSGATVIVVGLVNSGIMQLSQAIGIIMGANIGTTVTGQLIRLSDISGSGFFLQLLKPTTFAPIVAFIGAILFVFIKSPKKRNIGQIMMGFGILFTGMFTMERSVSVLRDSELFIQLFSTLENPFLGVLAGALVTVAIQSSSASVGILQALSVTDVITWGNAIPIILGQNIGTCSTPLLASIGASKAAKRSAFVHLYFNVIGTAVFLAAIYGFKAIIGVSFWDDVMGKGDIANFHTVFNIAVTVLFIPFAKLLAKLAELTVPDKQTDEPIDLEMPILDERLLHSPSVAIQQAKNAVLVMAKNARANCAEAVPLLIKPSKEPLIKINEREGICDKLEVAVSNYLIKVTDKELSDRESQNVNELLHYVVEFERIGDYAINVVERSGEMLDKELAFSEIAEKELLILNDAICEIVDLATQSLENNDLLIAEKVEPLEETIDLITETLRNKHITRLKEGVCNLESGIIFLEILSNLERISDHCSNIAARIIGSESHDNHFDAHEMRRRLHNGSVPNFNKMLSDYRAKYYDNIEM